MKVPKMYKSSDRYNAGTDVIYNDESKLQYAPFIYAGVTAKDNGDGGGDDEEGEDTMVVIYDSQAGTINKSFKDLKDALDAFSLSTTRIQCNEESLRKIFNDYGCIVPYKEIMEKYDGYIGDRDGEYDLEIALRYRKEIQQEISDYIREHNL